MDSVLDLIWRISERVMRRSSGLQGILVGEGRDVVCLTEAVPLGGYQCHWEEVKEEDVQQSRPYLMTPQRSLPESLRYLEKLYLIVNTQYA